MMQMLSLIHISTHIKRIVNGESTEAHLCSDCARALGYDSVFPYFGFNFSDMLGSFFNEATVGALSNGIVPVSYTHLKYTFCRRRAELQVLHMKSRRSLRMNLRIQEAESCTDCP